MTITKEKLLNIIKQAQAGVSTTHVFVQGSDTLTFKNGALHTYNDAISVSVPVAEMDIEGTLTAVEFTKYIEKLPAKSELTITATETAWMLTVGDSIEAEFSLLSESVSAHISQMQLNAQTWAALPPAFLTAIKACLLNGNNTPYNGIAVDNACMYSTDIIRMSFYTLSEDMPRFWIDDVAASALLQLEIEQYAVSNAWVHFRGESGIVFSAKRKSEEGFPFAQLPTIRANAVKADDALEGMFAVDVIDAVKRCATLSSSIGNSDAVRLSITGAFIEVSSSRRTGKVRERVAMEVPLPDSSEAVCYVTPDDFLAAVEHTRRFYIQKIAMGHHAASALIFSEGDFLQIVQLLDAK